jgi:hypothetical protein
MGIGTIDLLSMRGGNPRRGSSEGEREKENSPGEERPKKDQLNRNGRLDESVNLIPYIKPVI